MDLQKAYELYIDDLAEELKCLGFPKKSKNRFSRKIGNCRQEICVMLTKGRGIPHHDSVICSVLYFFDNINRIFYYIQGLPLRKGMATGRIFYVDEDLIYKEENHLRKHIVLEESDPMEIKAFAQEDAERIKRYYLPLLDKCDTEEKLLENIETEARIVNSIAYSGRVWYRISTLLSLGKKEEACKLFDHWKPVTYYREEELSEEEKQEVKRRMNGLDEKKIPKQYALFGRQGNGTIIPLDTDISER